MRTILTPFLLPLFILSALVSLHGLSACTLNETWPSADAGADASVCTSHSECTETNASRCELDAGTCEPCKAHTDCSHIEGKGVCEEGTCVECTAKDFAACDEGQKVCDASEHTCTEREIRSKQACGECIADVECLEGMLCVTEVFDETELGAVCLWRKDAEGTGAPNNNCGDNGRPYISAESRTSVNGVEAEVCTLALSTCLAHSQFREKSCSGETEEGHAECGEPDLSDAYCLEFDSGPPPTYRCTVPCLGVDDCKPGVGACITPAPVTGIPQDVCDL